MELHFVLTVQDDWPPVSVEGVPCTALGHGYRIEMPPLFVEGLSVGDVISAILDGDGNARTWNHITTSKHSTIWLLRLKELHIISEVLETLRNMGCNTVQFPECGTYSIDVPENLSLAEVDHVLDQLDRSHVAVAYPSLRHDRV